ncbi:hypothetical protein [Sphingopyxis sp. Root1497]|uniref:hypothetical protein n=1 Tax=Sphingopyxis sp. Root1497 TaxID=1736474 RepID=UPI000B206472|nr:hypothetical protein [Sphingopyxis sp. Root1497]
MNWEALGVVAALSAASGYIMGRKLHEGGAWIGVVAFGFAWYFGGSHVEATWITLLIVGVIAHQAGNARARFAAKRRSHDPRGK